jgi:hypothetical protein
MRRVSKAEQAKRGCRYCRYVDRVRESRAIFLACPANKCPFRELDKYKSYTDYLKENGGDKNMKEILKELGVYIWGR